jgi:hypothetical protein
LVACGNCEPNAISNAIDYAKFRSRSSCRHERVEFLWIFMLDRSLALRLKNRTVGLPRVRIAS